MEIQPVTAHSFRSGEKYYLLNEGVVKMCIEAIEQIHDVPPFPREKIRVMIDNVSDLTRTINDCVSPQRTYYGYNTCYMTCLP